MKRTGRRWTISKADHEELIRLYKEGVEVAALAVRYQKRIGTIYDYLRRDPAENPSTVTKSTKIGLRPAPVKTKRRKRRAPVRQAAASL